MAARTIFLEKREYAREADQVDCHRIARRGTDGNNDFAQALVVPLKKMGNTDLNKPKWALSEIALDCLAQVWAGEITQELEIASGRARHCPEDMAPNRSEAQLVLARFYVPLHLKKPAICVL